MKQADQSWGAPTAEAEWGDEKAGEAIAQAEATDGGWDAKVPPPLDDDGATPADAGAPAEANGSGAAPAASAPEPEPEPEDNSRSYAEWKAEQDAKRAELGTALPEARKPNEGSKIDKKWAAAKPLSKTDEEEEYISGKGGKAGRTRERKTKETVEIDHRFVEQPRGERGRGRGGRGGEFRGGDRGGRGGGEFRGGDRGGRGGGFGGRGGRGGGERGEFRGGRGGDFRGGRGDRGGGGRGRGDAVNVADTSAFPELGA